MGSAGEEGHRRGTVRGQQLGPICRRARLRSTWSWTATATEQAHAAPRCASGDEAARRCALVLGIPSNRRHRPMRHAHTPQTPCYVCIAPQAAQPCAPLLGDLVAGLQISVCPPPARDRPRNSRSPSFCFTTASRKAELQRLS